MNISSEEKSEICLKVYDMQHDDESTKLDINVYLLGVILFEMVNWRKEDQ